MKLRLTTLMFTLALALAVPAGAWAQSLDEAAQQAARQYNAKVLSAQTVQEGNKKVHVIKLLTKDGVVKTVRVPVRER
jgi:outer membrane lipoprotein-sorting protein